MRWLLLPFSILYQIITWFRNFLYDNEILKSKEFDISVISIGNLTVGGTGKTPHTEYLIRLFSSIFNIAILSRGYKRKTKGFILVNSKSTYEDIGDEPKQMQMKFPKVKIAVCRKRTEGVTKLLNYDKNISTVILDDAHQHRKITPSLMILLTDYNNLFYNDSFMPYGKLRDNISQYKRANIIIITKCPLGLKPIERRIIAQDLNLMPYQTIFFTYIKYGKIKHIKKSKRAKVNSKTKILLITGIANAKPLVEYLEKTTKNIIHINFPDHFSFNKKSIEKINTTFNKIDTEDKIIITTEKDAVRLRNNNLLTLEVSNFLYYIPIEIDFLFQTKNEFNNQIINYVRKNKANYDLRTTKNQF